MALPALNPRARFGHVTQMALAAACGVSFVSFTSDGLVLPLRAAREAPASLYDFRGPYFGALDLREHDDPYALSGERRSDQMARRFGFARMRTLYSPPALAAYTPLSYLPFGRAKVIYLVFSFASACAAIPLIARLLAPGGPPEWAAAGLLVAWFPEVRRALAMGQASVPLLPVLALALLCAARRRDGATGGLIAVAGLVKPTPLVALAAFVLRRRLRAPITAIGAMALATAASIAAFGIGPHRRFLQSTRDAVAVVVTQQDNQSLTGAAARALGADPAGSPAPPGASWLAGVTGLAVILVSVAATLAGPAAAPEVTASLWLVAGLLVSPLTWHHHLVWLLPPLAVAGGRGVASSRPWLLGALVLVLAATGTPAHLARALAVAGTPAPILTALPALGLVVLLGVLASLHFGAAAEAAPGAPG